MGLVFATCGTKVFSGTGCWSQYILFRFSEIQTFRIPGYHSSSDTTAHGGCLCPCLSPSQRWWADAFSSPTSSPFSPKWAVHFPLVRKQNYSELPHLFHIYLTPMSTPLALQAMTWMSSPSCCQRSGTPTCTSCHLFLNLQDRSSSDSLFLQPVLVNHLPLFRDNSPTCTHDIIYAKLIV